MEHRIMTREALEAFARALLEQERSSGTIEKYFRDVRAFTVWLGGAEVTRERAAAWRDSLLERGYAPVTVNSMVAAVNQFFTFLGWEDCKVKALKLQRKLFRDDRRELTREEYERLLAAAHGLGRERLALLLETICSTGIRVSELRFITAETLASGRTEIRLKGKSRVVLLPRELAQRLRQYAQARGIRSGPLFRTRTGMPLDRSNIWREMKTLCREAGVAPEKVFPHNLRHLFARSFYEQEKDLAHLADILGHSSIETTRIYVAVSTQVHEQMLQRMRLIL